MAWTWATGNTGVELRGDRTPYNSWCECSGPGGDEDSQARVYYESYKPNEIGVFAEHSAHPVEQRDDGEEEWDGEGRARVLWQQAYSVLPGHSLWSFEVSGGSLSIGGGGGGAGYTEAGYSIEILVNGGIVWSSEAVLWGWLINREYAESSDENHWSAGCFNDALNRLGISGSDTQSGTVTDVSFERSAFTIDLANYVNSGSYANVEYIMEAWATDMPGGTSVTDIEFVTFGIATIGDPFGLDGGSGVIIDDASLYRVSTVPLPAPISLLLSGFLSIAGLKRWKKMTS